MRISSTTFWRFFFATAAVLSLVNGIPWGPHYGAIGQSFSVRSLTTKRVPRGGGGGGCGDDICGTRLGWSALRDVNTNEKTTNFLDSTARGGHSALRLENLEEEVVEEDESQFGGRGGGEYALGALSLGRSVNTGESMKETFALPKPTNGTTTVPVIHHQEYQVELSHADHKKLQRSIDRHKSYTRKLKNRNNLNLRRKALHASWGLLFAALNHVLPRKPFVLAMSVITTTSLLVELLRYRPGFGWMNDALHSILGSSLRKQEMDGKFTGSFYFFLGVTMTSALYPTTAATMGICQLALADPSASFFGRQTRHIYWSRIENGLGGFGRNKGILGFLGGALFCFPFNYRALSLANFAGNGLIPGGRGSLVFASLALGVAGAFADLAVPTPALTLPKCVLGVRVPPFHVDDNFVVPIVSGFACSRVFNLLGWPADLKLARGIVF